MADYTRGTGNSGTMLIRDLGFVVEFWITANNQTTYAYQMPWGFTANGIAPNFQYRYNAGAGWQRLGSVNIWGSQNVTFRLGSTGTSGLGGPTNFTVYISRSTIPNPPQAPAYANVTSTSADVWTGSNGDGGQPILEWQITWGTDPNGGQYSHNQISGNFAGLTPGTTYYFWARARNTHGWSGWSPRSQLTTLRVPDAPTSPVIENIKQTTVLASFLPNGDGGTAITSYQLGWGTSDSAPTSTMAALLSEEIDELEPGTTYYFFARAQNAVGWGPWSSPSVAKTIAGARILVVEGITPVWKDAVPYVKVAGQWKLARPWVKVGGVWKETT